MNEILTELRRQYKDADYFKRRDTIYVSLRLADDITIKAIIKHASRFTTAAHLQEYITSVYLRYFTPCNAKSID